VTEDPDEAAAERRFLQPINPDPVTALAKHPPPKEDDMEDTRVRWRDISPTASDPDAIVEVQGHPLYRYDDDKARRMVMRALSLGGTKFIGSPDLAWMHTPVTTGVPTIRLRALGFTIECDPKLPPDTIQRAD
jgi:hypothetical protein